MSTSPTIALNKLGSGSGASLNKSIVFSPDGYLYIAGTRSPAFGELPNNGTDGYLSKITVSGDLIWSLPLTSSRNDSANSVSIGLDGSIYVSGFTQGTLDGQTNGRGQDIYVTKVSQAGSTIWTRLYGTSGTEEAIASVMGLDGQLYITGSTTGNLAGQTNNGATDAYLSKIAADGTQLWTQLIGSKEYDYGNSVSVGLDGSIYVVGQVSVGGYLSIDSQSSSSPVSPFISKFTPDGIKVWTKLINNTEFASAQSISSSPDGFLYITGWTSDGKTLTGGNDAFIVKMNSQGSIIWSKNFGATNENDFPTSVIYGLDDYIYVGGSTSGSFNNQLNNGNGDIFVAKISKDGIFSWTKFIGTTEEDKIYGLKVLENTDIYLVGSTSGSFPNQVNVGVSKDLLVILQQTNSTSNVVTNNVSSIAYGNGKKYISTAGADKITGTLFVDVLQEFSNFSSNKLTKNLDSSWEVQSKINSFNLDTIMNIERIEFSDMSVALDLSGAAGQVAKILGSVFGKSYVSNTEFAGIGFAYLDGGMSYLDLCGLAAGAAGLSTPDLLVTTLLRNTTGTEPTALSKSSYLQSISSGSSYASVVQQIADSSANAQSIKLTDLANTGLAFKPYVFPPTYSLSATSNSVNEGLTAVFNLTTTNVAVGTEVSYTLLGISPSDLTSGTLTGKVSIGLGGIASISVPIAADGATEGQESLTISAQGATASTVINDTSKSSIAPTYTLTPATLSVNEGELARVYVSTTNVPAGTALQYGISGLSSNDLIGEMTRLVTVDSFGQAFINIQTISDLITEGPETMYIIMGTSISSLTINDTSVTLVGVIESGGGDGGGSGGGGAGGD